MIKSILYKLSIFALFIFVLSTLITIWAIFDISVTKMVREYLTMWLSISFICVLLIIPHMIDSYREQK